MKRVTITTLGCKVNQYESAAFASAFAEAGYAVAEAGQTADIVVVNTCAVTGKAGAQSRQAVRQAIRKNPGARILITGCYAETGAEQLAELDELAGREYSIIGNSKKDELVPTAIGYDRELERMVLGAVDQAREICRLPVRRFGERTRAYLRVQDGCESFCTYCIVPFTRGPSRSLPLAEVLEQARVFAAEGYREVVLTGIHIGNYGRDLAEESDIVDLLEQLSSETPGVRYRLSSIEPTEVGEQLLDLFAKRDNLAAHLHIPLQSGCDRILEKMGRKYTTAEFARVIEACRRRLPDAAIGIDVLAGFPGETEEDFENTRNFLASIDCTYLHVFPYSKRPGTVAATMKGEVPKAVKDRRVAELRALGEEKRRIFHARQLGAVRPVLVEGKRDDKGLVKGFTDNYIPVHFPGEDHLINCLVEVRLLRLDGAQAIGEVSDHNEN